MDAQGNRSKSPASVSSYTAVAYHWRIDRPTPLPQIAAELSEKNCGCAIFNLRAHAKSLYRQLCQLCGPEDVFYLSTDLCTAHRRVVLERVKSRITQGRRCYLAATQCIEAGVDLDFPLVYRALAPLEAIIQAAGRCNRNGAALTGRVEVFVPDEPRLYPPDGHYEEAANCVAILASRHPVECSNLDHIKEYYQLLYSNAKGDDPVLKRAIEQEDFSGVQEAYRLIRSKGVEVIVPFSQQMELFQNIQEEYDRFGLSPSLLKKARSLIVSSFYEQEVKDHCIPLWFRSPEGEKTLWAVICSATLPFIPTALAWILSRLTIYNLYGNEKRGWY